MFKFLTYKEKADKSKAKVIKREVKELKKQCISSFKSIVKNGLYSTTISLLGIPWDFQEEVSEIALKELALEHSDIKFSFIYNGFNCSYKNIKVEVVGGIK